MEETKTGGFKKWIWIVVVIVIAVIIIIVSLSQKTNKQSLTYSIGAVLPLSAGAANIGVPFQQGMQQAVDEVNKAGGINGNKVVLYVEDGQFEGSKSVSAVQSLLSTHNPDVFDILFNPIAQAVSPTLKSAGKPFLHWDYSHSVISQNELAYKTGFDAESGCQMLIQYAKDHAYYSKLGVLMSKTSFNDDCLAGVKKVEPGVKEYRYQFGETDFKTYLAKANADGVSTIVFVPIDPEPVQIFKQLDNLGYPINVICATAPECIYPDVSNTVSAKVLNGTLSVDFTPATFPQSEFVKQFKMSHPKEADSSSVTWAAMGYDDATIIMKAMAKCEPGESSCIAKALGTVKNYNSIIGSNGFSNRIENLSLRVVQYLNGVWVTSQQ
jgi:branched-chain amino acid transport system substrate-binding protein